MNGRERDRERVELGEVLAYLDLQRAQPYGAASLRAELEEMHVARVTAADAARIEERLQEARRMVEELEAKLRAHDEAGKRRNGADPYGRLVRLTPDQVGRTRGRLESYRVERDTLERILQETQAEREAIEKERRERKLRRFPQLRTLKRGWERDGLPNPNARE